MIGARLETQTEHCVEKFGLKGKTCTFFRNKNIKKLTIFVRSL